MSVRSLFRRRPRNEAPTQPESVSQLPASDNPLLAKRRYARLINRRLANGSADFDAHDQAIAWLYVEQDMALVPGLDSIPSQPGAPQPETKDPERMAAYYLDRWAVSNADFHRFVEDGGYSQTELWPESIWPNVLQFIDQSGSPGPRYWTNGRFARGQERHPVVGVCWYEANAFALWSGKRLPESEEWQHAGSWCAGSEGNGGQSRYPWGNTFEQSKANTWHSGPGETSPVDEYRSGSTPNGLYQLIGNVWEWVATPYRCGSAHDDLQILFTQPMAEVRGGAFDTYFDSQATCFFRTGQPLLHRGRNVGFRCAISTTELLDPPDPTVYVDA